MPAGAGSYTLQHQHRLQTDRFLVGMAPNSDTLLTVFGQIQDCSLLLSFLAATDAKALSLTCREMNRLCFEAVKALNVPIATCKDTDTATAISKSFSKCTHVALGIHSREERLDAGVVVLPALARLPHLESLDVHMPRDGSGAKEAAFLLEMVRLQLPGLKNLSVSDEKSWAGLNLPWQVLGGATLLRALGVHFTTGTQDALRMSHLTALEPLSSNLRSLVLEGEHLLPEAHDFGFLGSLTNLTHLHLPLASTDGISCISVCTNLQNLMLDADKQHENAGVVLLEDSYTTFARLTKLTELRLPNVGATGGNLEFVQVLKAMPQLQILRCDGLNRQALPLLAQMTNLTDIGSCRDEADVDVAPGHVCSLSCVQSFGGCGPIPFEALPHVQRLCQWEPWPPSNFLAVARHCRKLRIFEHGTWTDDTISMQADASEAERVAALRALATLEHLTKLRFAPIDDTELAVLAGLSRLRTLHLLACSGTDPIHPSLVAAQSACSFPALMLLCLMRGLRSLVLELPGIEVISSSHARLLILGLQCVPDVVLCVRPTCKVALDQAKQAAKAAGLPMPDILVVKGCYADLDLPRLDELVD